MEFCARGVASTLAPLVEVRSRHTAHFIAFPDFQLTVFKIFYTRNCLQLLTRYCILIACLYISLTFFRWETSILFFIYILYTYTNLLLIFTYIYTPNQKSVLLVKSSSCAKFKSSRCSHQSSIDLEQHPSYEHRKKNLSATSRLSIWKIFTYILACW